MTETTEVTKSRLRRERERLGLSVRSVAEAVGAEPSNLSRIELGQQPNRDLARKLFKFYRGRVRLGDVYDPLYSIEVGGQYRGKLKP